MLERYIHQGLQMLFAFNKVKPLWIFFYETRKASTVGKLHGHIRNMPLLYLCKPSARWKNNVHINSLCIVALTFTICPIWDFTILLFQLLSITQSTTWSTQHVVPERTPIILEILGGLLLALVVSMFSLRNTLKSVI